MVLAATVADLGLSWWWIGLATIGVLALSVYLIPGMMWEDDKQRGKQKQPTPSLRSETMPQAATSKRRAANNGLNQDTLKSHISEEPWVPEVEIKSWEEAGQLAGCPWCFDGCDGIPEVLQRIWKQPLSQGLQQSLMALQARVKNVRLARVNYRMTDEVVHAVLYTLQSNAELFGCQPLDQAVGLDLEGESEPGIRRRKNGNHHLSLLSSGEADEIGLTCLAPFYRIHDGFGCLLSTKHLAAVLAHVGDTVGGSCFYVYPGRYLRPLSRRPTLLKFARVDKNCDACADCREEHPHVVFAEHSGDLVDDDESPLDFVADTVCNIAGQKVVPDVHGYYGYGSH
jgi:hypothetical protein